MSDPVSMGDSANNLFKIAKRTLDFCAEALDVNVPNTMAAPERQYVSFGEAPWDTADQLVVHVESPRISTEFPYPHTDAILTPTMWVADFVVTLNRVFPEDVQVNGALLDTTTLNEVAQLLYADGLAMYQAVIVGWSNINSAHNYLVAVTPLTPINPEGQSAGWTFTLTTEVDSACLLAA